MKNAGSVLLGVVIGVCIAYLLMIWVFPVPSYHRTLVLQEMVDHPDRFHIKVFYNPETHDTITVIKYEYHE